MAIDWLVEFVLILAACVLTMEREVCLGGTSCSLGAQTMHVIVNWLFICV